MADKKNMHEAVVSEKICMHEAAQGKVQGKVYSSLKMTERNDRGE